MPQASVQLALRFSVKDYAKIEKAWEETGKKDTITKFAHDRLLDMVDEGRGRGRSVPQSG